MNRGRRGPGARRRAGLGPALAVLAVGFALAQGYRVDDAGGPLTLGEDVATAAAVWREAAGEAAAGLTEAGAGPHLIRYGDPARFGPDTHTLTLRRAPDRPGLTVLVDPNSYRSQPAALVHEFGLLLGLPAGTEGVMSPALTGEAVAPSAEVLDALRVAVSAVPGDVTGDGRVDIHDLAAVAAAFGRRGVNLPEDLDGDGVVGDGDLEVLRLHYEFLPPEPPAGAPGPAGENQDAEPE